MQEIPRSQNRIQRRPITPAPKSQSVPLPDYADPQKPAIKELTRGEYLVLLKMARQMRRETAYLAMRLFVSTGIQLQELLALTAEAVRAGEIETPERAVHLPDSLREELLDYAERSGVRGGAIFVNKTGAPLNAATVRQQLRAVGQAAGLEVNVRMLQKLYAATRAEMAAGAAERLLREQLDREQAEHGWEA